MQNEQQNENVQSIPASGGSIPLSGIDNSPRSVIEQHILSGLRTLAGQCDGARQRDDVGFAASDVYTGHCLARSAKLSDRQLSIGLSLCFKYQRQLGPDFTSKLTQMALDAELPATSLSMHTEEKAVPTPAKPTPGLVPPKEVYRYAVEATHLTGGQNIQSLPKTVDFETDDEKVLYLDGKPVDYDLRDVVALTDEQECAIDTIMSWVEKSLRDKATSGYRGKPPEYRLGGYAGTGKTTVTKVLRSELAYKYHSVVCAFTGKAVNVLQRKGVSSQTMHSLMYDVNEDQDGNITFTKKYCLKDDPSLIVIDEASMISVELYNDLKSFGVPLLFVGDPGQLEPVGDNPNLMAHPDMVLQKIHRQAAQSPIIKLANSVRLGGPIPRNVTSNELITKPKVVRASEYLDANQIICARNKTRQGLNKSLRLHKGLPPFEVVEGEKIICLRNNRRRNVFNGQIFFIKKVSAVGPTYWMCDLEDEVGIKYRDMKIWKEPFLMPLVQDARVPSDHIYCDYGYCITCHKSQGSEWDSVVVLDEWMPPSVWDMKRWRYTAITRAAKKLTYCI